MRQGIFRPVGIDEVIHILHRYGFCGCTIAVTLDAWVKGMHSALNAQFGCDIEVEAVFGSDYSEVIKRIVRQAHVATKIRKTLIEFVMGIVIDLRVF